LKSFASLQRLARADVARPALEPAVFVSGPAIKVQRSRLTGRANQSSTRL
jgi:hypothetical protein